MIKVLFISTLLLFTLNARENPFFPSTGEKDILITTNENGAQTPLKRATIALPTQARVLQKVTIEYKNLDGSLETKTIELENSVDWHLPIFISQNYSDVPNNTIHVEATAAPVKKKKKVEPVVNQKKSPQTDTKFENIASIPFLKLYSSGKNLKLVTDDEMIRNFLIVNPHKIVIDFKKETDIKSYVFETSKNIFKEVSIGNHEGYYRVAIELDGLYRYDFKKISEGYLVELK